MKKYKYLPDHEIWDDEGGHRRADLAIKSQIRDALQDMLKWTILASACLSVAAIGILIIVWSVLK